MSCSRLRKHGSEPDLDRHAESCPSCREWAARQRRARAATARLAQVLALEAAKPAPVVEAALRQAFRDHARRSPAADRVGPAPGRLAWALRLTLVGAAAVLIVLAGVHRPHPSPSPVVAKPSWGRPAALPSPHVAPTAAAPAVAAIRRSTRPHAAARLAGAEPPVAPPVDAAGPASEPNAADAVVALPVAGGDSAAAIRPGVATENTAELADTGAFIPLLTEPEPSAIESGQIVRVQLTEEELRAAKLPAPIGSAGATGRIEAEVLVGPDGVARGIRPARPRE